MKTNYLKDRRFVNVYEIQYNWPKALNIVKCIGSNESENLAIAKQNFNFIKSSNVFKEPKFSIMLESFDARLNP